MAQAKNGDTVKVGQSEFTFYTEEAIPFVEETSPQVYLNHFYFVLDSSACREIEKSDFIRDEFSSVKERAKGGNRALASG